MMKTLLLGSVLAMLATPGAWAETAAFRQEAQSACMMDVMYLCPSSIPDEGSIISCMQSRRTQLSAPCRKVFDVGMRSRRLQSSR